MRQIMWFSLTVLVAALCAGLGIWQLRRLSERRAVNRVALAGLELPPLRLDALGVSPVAQRRAVAVGEYDEARQFILRGRLVQDAPAVQVVTPFRIHGSDTALLVNRGYVPTPDATTPPADAAFAEPGARTIHGILLPVPDRSDGAPASRGGRETWHRLDLTAMRGRLPYPVFDTYLIAQPDSSSGKHTARGGGYPIRVEPPPLGNGPHLSYAIQWFGIGTAAVVFGIVFVLGKGARRLGR